MNETTEETTTQKPRMRDNTKLMMGIVVLIVALACIMGYSLGYQHSLAKWDLMMDVYMTVNNCVCLPIP